MAELTSKRVNAARAVAMIADLVQMGLFPLFIEGALSPANDILDVIVALVLIRLIGWSWAFLPTFTAELVPTVDLFPTWTAAVLFATRHGATAPLAQPPVEGQVIDVQPSAPKEGGQDVLGSRPDRNLP